MQWTDEADSILVKLWNDGCPMAVIAQGICNAGYTVTRNMVAGRKFRIQGLHEMAPRLPLVRPPPKPRRRTVRLKGRADTVDDKVVASRRPVTAADTDAALKNPGVDYLANEKGCKALLDTRSGQWNLLKCCGLPRGVDYDGRESSYCYFHFRLHTHPPQQRRYG